MTYDVVLSIRGLALHIVRSYSEAVHSLRQCRNKTLLLLRALGIVSSQVTELHIVSAEIGLRRCWLFYISTN